MRFIIALMLAVCVCAQDAAAPDTTPDERAILFQAQRDTLAALQHQMEVVARIEQRAGCKLNMQTAHCQPKVESKK